MNTVQSDHYNEYWEDIKTSLSTPQSEKALVARLKQVICLIYCQTSQRFSKIFQFIGQIVLTLRIRVLKKIQNLRKSWNIFKVKNF